MSAPESDPADVIARALARIRTRGRGSRGGLGDHGDHHRGHHGHGPHGEHRGGPFGPGPLGGPPMRAGGPARVRMLEALAAASDSLSVSEIGEAIGVDQPRASRLVQQGVELGLVQRQADPDDARRTRIALTEQGREIAHRLRGQRRGAVEQALESFTDPERAELARLLTKLADNWTP